MSSHLFYFKRGPILHIFRYAPDIPEHWVRMKFSGKFISGGICSVLLSISHRMESISLLFLPLSFLIFYQSYMILILSFWFLSICTGEILHATYIHHTFNIHSLKYDKACRIDVWSMYDLRTQTVYKSYCYIQKHVGSRNIPVQTFIRFWSPVTFIHDINMTIDATLYPETLLHEGPF